MNFITDKFNNFAQHLLEIIFSMKGMREDNRVLKVQNLKFNSEIMFLAYHVNVLEHKAFDNFIEIIGIPEIKDEDCIDTAKIIVV